MTGSIVTMSIIGVILIIASFLISEKLTKKESSFNIDLLTVNENYEFSEREQNIIKRKIEDVIAKQAKDILYETNDSLANMANEKMMALGDYAVAVCDEIEKNHKEVMFLYGMLDDKQKEIMNTVKIVDETKHDVLEINDKLNLKIEQQSGQIKKRGSLEESVVKGESSVSNQNIEEKDLKNKEEHPEIKAEDISSEENEQEPECNDNSNSLILEMYQNGDSIIEIAKQLGLGVGEVKLVVDLYQGE